MPTRCWPPLRCVGLIHISGIALAIVDDRGRRNLLKALHAVLRREASCHKTRMPGPGSGGTHPRCGMPFEKPSRSRTSLCRASTTRRHSGTMWTPKRRQSGLAMRAFKKSLSKADPPQWLSSTKARSFASHPEGQQSLRHDLGRRFLQRRLPSRPPGRNASIGGLQAGARRGWRGDWPFWRPGARALPWSAFKGSLTRRPRKPEAKKRGPLMFIRLAFFEGVMRLGRETDFDRYVRDTLLLARDAARLARRDHARGRSG